MTLRNHCARMAAIAVNPELLTRAVALAEAHPISAATLGLGEGSPAAFQGYPI